MPRLGRESGSGLVSGLDVERWCLLARKKGPGSPCQEMGDLFNQYVYLRHSSCMLSPGQSLRRFLAGLIGQVVELDPPVGRIPIPLQVLSRLPVRGVPSAF